MNSENDIARRVVDAIRLFNRVTFKTSDAPPNDDVGMGIVIAYSFTKKFEDAGQPRPTIKHYQRFGISSRSVASAVELGVLIPVLAEESNDD